MFGSDVLEVGTGMVLVYLLLSLICSAISEIVEGFMKTRAAQLELGIKQLVFADKGKSLVKAIYDHPLIRSLAKADYSPGNTKTLPSYIPARNFALALLDTVLPANATASGASASTAPAIPPAASMADLRAAIGKLGNPHVERALVALIDAAGNDIRRARENIEAWYDSAMERVSGWYKRRTQMFLLACGLAVAIVNADSITIAQQLSVDRPLREALVAVSTQYANPPPNVPAADAKTRLDDNLKKIRTLGLPVGWTSDDNDPRSLRVSPGRWFLRVIGWILTACAVSLGAPFWFDLLNKVSVVRSTVKPHEKSREEKSKD